MMVLAKDSRGGRRYQTQKGVFVEVAPVSYRDDRPRKDSDGNILVWLVNERGELDKRRLVQIPGIYELTDPNPPKELLPKEPGKRGRRPHADKTWRGWAFDHQDICQAVVTEAQTQGCYTVPATNYITVGWGGKKIFVVFRSGVLGFDDVPKYILAFRTKKVSGRFSPHRLELRKVIADGMRVELIRALRQHISDFKSQTQGVNKALTPPVEA